MGMNNIQAHERTWKASSLLVTSVHLATRFAGIIGSGSSFRRRMNVSPAASAVSGFVSDPWNGNSAPVSKHCRDNVNGPGGAGKADRRVTSQIVPTKL